MTQAAKKYYKGNFRIFVSSKRAVTLSKSAVFRSFEKVRSLSLQSQLDLARLYLRREDSSLLGESPVFDINFYAKNFKNRSKFPTNLLLHYVNVGWEENLNPSAAVHVAYYKQQAREKGIDLTVEPFQHYVEGGFRSNLSLNTYFDNDWYWNTYLNEGASSMSPFEHFLFYGSAAKLNPAPFFSVQKVEADSGQPIATSLEAIAAYEAASEKGMPIDPHPLFDERYYKKLYADVSENKMTAAQHFICYGVSEGRSTIDLKSSPADQTSGIDAFQYRFVDFNNYFGIKRIFSYYDLLWRLDHSMKNVDQAKDRAPRPLAIISTFNDQDCIEYIIAAAIREGLSVWIVDNWSTDHTFDIVQKLLKIPSFADHFEGAERFPVDGPQQHYDWHGILQRKAQIAAKFPGRWILHQDSDEITVSLFPNRTCAETLGAIGDLGYNLVNMRMFDFRPINRDEPDANLEKHFEYFEFSNKPAYGTQLKAWIQPKQIVDLSSSGGHIATFPGSKAFPLRLPRKHYALRSVAHAMRKIRKERLPRFEREKAERGWHTHYDSGLNEEDFVWNPDTLQKYVANGHVSIWLEMLYNEENSSWI
ncbi:glycosyltransferase family protein [Methylobacterium oxalidis]|uniref:glycosyltransferase family 2 protein n=1 Tax=Methylobacterium oxalidis TaxID=944322 RepID=UPI003315DD82